MMQARWMAIYSEKADAISLLLEIILAKGTANI